MKHGACIVEGLANSSSGCVLIGASACSVWLCAVWSLCNQIVSVFVQLAALVFQLSCAAELQQASVTKTIVITVLNCGEIVKSGCWCAVPLKFFF